MHPSIGRFMQKDPSMYVDGMNDYSYVTNSPIIFFDKTGQAQEISNGSAAVLGAFGGAVTGTVVGFLVGGPIGMVYGGFAGILPGMGLGVWSNEGFPIPNPFEGLGRNNGYQLDDDDIDDLMRKCCAEHGYGCGEPGHDTCMKGQWTLTCTRDRVVRKELTGHY